MSPARSLAPFGHAVVKRIGVERIEQLSNLTPAMQRRGWSEARTRKVLGENWLAYVKTIWGA